MATRLRASGFMDWLRYNAWRKEWESYVAALRPRKGGFAHPVDQALGRNGRPFVRVVLEALSSNRITVVDASHHLNLKAAHFEKLRGALTDHPGAGEAADE